MYDPLAPLVELLARRVFASDSGKLRGIEDTTGRQGSTVE
jgi:hypothetical protein